MSRVRVPDGVPKWPVGQVVKTAASHAVNIGSNPVRVTKVFLDKGSEIQYNTVCSPARPDDIELVLIRARVHPFPFRTR